MIVNKRHRHTIFAACTLLWTLASAHGADLGIASSDGLTTPRWKQGDTELPAVDDSVARGPDGKPHLALVNLEPVRPARVATNLKSDARGQVLTGAAMDAHNTFDKPQTLLPTPYTVGAGGQGLALELPAKSVVVVTLN